MKKFLIVSLVVAALTACGSGGSGSGNPIPIPSQKPPQQYSLKLNFVGGDQLHATKIQSLGNRHMAMVYSHVLDTSSAANLAPIVISDNSFDPQSHYGQQNFGSGVLQVSVSPEPSSSPNISVNVSGLPVTTSPLPIPSVAPTNPPSFNIQAQPSATPGAGTINVSATGSVSLNETDNMYLIRYAHIGCDSAPVIGEFGVIYPSDQVGGIKFVNGQAIPVSNQSDADIYFAGNYCTAVGFNDSSDSSGSIHYPYGATSISSTVTGYTSITSSMFANSFNSETISAIQSNLMNGATPLDERIIQTHSGQFVRIAVNGVGTSSTDATFEFSFEQYGNSIAPFQ